MDNTRSGRKKIGVCRSPRRPRNDFVDSHMSLCRCYCCYTLSPTFVIDCLFCAAKTLARVSGSSSMTSRPIPYSLSASEDHVPDLKMRAALLSANKIRQWRTIAAQQLLSVDKLESISKDLLIQCSFEFAYLSENGSTITDVQTLTRLRRGTKQ